MTTVPVQKVGRQDGSFCGGRRDGELTHRSDAKESSPLSSPLLPSEPLPPAECVLKLASKFVADGSWLWDDWDRDCWPSARRTALLRGAAEGRVNCECWVGCWEAVLDEWDPV